MSPAEMCSLFSPFAFILFHSARRRSLPGASVPRPRTRSRMVASRSVGEVSEDQSLKRSNFVSGGLAGSLGSLGYLGLVPLWKDHVEGAGARGLPHVPTWWSRWLLSDVVVSCPASRPCPRLLAPLFLAGIPRHPLDLRLPGRGARDDVPARLEGWRGKMPLLPLVARWRCDELGCSVGLLARDDRRRPWIRSRV